MYQSDLLMLRWFLVVNNISGVAVTRGILLCEMQCLATTADASFKSLIGMEDLSTISKLHLFHLMTRHLSKRPCQITHTDGWRHVDLKPMNTHLHIEFQLHSSEFISGLRCCSSRFNSCFLSHTQK